MKAIENPCASSLEDRLAAAIRLAVMTASRPVVENRKTYYLVPARVMQALEEVNLARILAPMGREPRPMTLAALKTKEMP